jgi:hypothetical protein
LRERTLHSCRVPFRDPEFFFFFFDTFWWRLLSSKMNELLGKDAMDLVVWNEEDACAKIV